MSKDASPRAPAVDPLEHARGIINHEAAALTRLAERLDDSFLRAVDLVRQCRGGVIVTGIGKAGLIGQKIVATLASTGTRAHFLHPAEAVHGDLGRVGPDDVILAFSYSGESSEVTRILPSLTETGAALIAVTGRPRSTLAAAATVTLDLGTLTEACHLGLAPSTSTTTMLALGDALALVVSRLREFQPSDFARFHPAGSLGLKLSRVDEHLRPLGECRVASDAESVREILVRESRPGRRSGAILLTGADGRLTGLFTDSDLARLFEARRDSSLDDPIDEVMTRRPLTAAAGSLMVDALALMAERKISELPIVDAAGRPVGIIDITDVLALFPDELATAHFAQSAPAAETSRAARPPRPKFLRSGEPRAAADS